MVNSSWLVPEGLVTSGAMFCGWFFESGSCVDGCSGFGGHFGFPPPEGLWVSSFAVPSRVGFRAENTVSALVGFSAS